MILELPDGTEHVRVAHEANLGVRFWLGMSVRPNQALGCWYIPDPKGSRLVLPKQGLELADEMIAQHSELSPIRWSYVGDTWRFNVFRFEHGDQNQFLTRALWHPSGGLQLDLCNPATPEDIEAARLFVWDPMTPTRGESQ